jgi:ornithine decarboxylase
MMVLRLLNFFGTGFECASMKEMQQVLSLGISPHRIIYGNPIKQKSYIEYSKNMHVDMLVFDNEYELIKIYKIHPHAKCFMRIKVDSLPCKFGPEDEEAEKLIELAIKLNINLIGISFYVGFRQKSPKNFVSSLKKARHFFDLANEKYNHKMYMIDIGKKKEKKL